MAGPSLDHRLFLGFCTISAASRGCREAGYVGSRGASPGTTQPRLRWTGCSKCHGTSMCSMWLWSGSYVLNIHGGLAPPLCLTSMMPGIGVHFLIKDQSLGRVTMMMMMHLDHEPLCVMCFISIASLNPGTEFIESKFKEKTTSLARKWQVSLNPTSCR